MTYRSSGRGFGVRGAGDRSRRSLTRALQVAFLIGAGWFAARMLSGQWSEVAAVSRNLRPDWIRVAWSALIVFASYAVLIATWRSTVAAWDERLPLRAAARIWFVSNLGRYIPGKVWQVGAMGVMAHDAGVSAVAAVGSALVISLVNVLVGFAVVAVTGGALLTSAIGADAGATAGGLVGGMPVMTILLLALAVAGVVALPWVLPPLMRLAARLTGRASLGTGRQLPARAIWIAAAGCAVAWVLYGLAFRQLAVALLGTASGDAAAYVAVFTLSYLVGFLVLIAPGGLVAREVSMLSLLGAAGLASQSEAAVLVVASRLWLTVLEIVPGVLLLAWPGRQRGSPGAANAPEEASRHITPSENR